MIQLGSVGTYVRVWQRIVGAKADGNFGPKTDTAVRAWQAARGVEADGVVGALTRAALAPGDLIKPYEGLRLATYDDHDGKPLQRVADQWRRPDGAICRGYATIGWGRRLYPGEWLTTCTRAEADAWFAEDLESVRLPAVRRYVVSGDAAQVCAAASFTYNCGTGALARLAAAQFDAFWWRDHYVTTRGVIDAGLRARRAEEAALWWGATA